jgi:O-antigen/teichoic acid export membrane protein
VLSVKICEHYGRSNSAKDALRRIIKPVVLMTLASFPLIAIGWLLMPRAVNVLIPRYVEATFLMQIFLVMIPVTMLKIPTAVLWVAAKLVDCFVSVAVGFAAFVLSAYCFYWMSFGMVGVAVAFLIGQVVYLLVSWVYTLRLLHQERGNLTRLDESMLSVPAMDRGVAAVD